MIILMCLKQMNFPNLLKIKNRSLIMTIIEMIDNSIEVIEMIEIKEVIFKIREVVIFRIEKIMIIKEEVVSKMIEIISKN